MGQSGQDCALAEDIGMERTTKSYSYGLGPRCARQPAGEQGKHQRRR